MGGLAGRDTGTGRGSWDREVLKEESGGTRKRFHLEDEAGKMRPGLDDEAVGLDDEAVGLVAEAMA